MRIRWKSIGCVGLIVGASATAWAEPNADPSPDPASSEPFVEVPASQEEPAREPDEYSVSTVVRSAKKVIETDRAANVVDRDTMDERQAKTPTDALSEEVGIFVQKTNRGAGAVIIRGSIGPENLYYFDGIRFSQSTFRTGPNQYLNTIDGWALDRVEVLRGPGGALYGSGAIGGVVQLFPVPLATEDGTNMVFRLATESADLSLGGSIDASAKYDRFMINLGGSYRNHNDLRGGQNGGDSIVAANEEENSLVSSDFGEFYMRGGIGYQLSAKNSVRLNYNGGVVFDAPRTDRIGDGEIRRYTNRDDVLYATYEYDSVGVWDEIALNMSWHRTKEQVARSNCYKTSDEPDGPTYAPDPVGCARLQDDLVEKQRLTNDTVNTFGTSLVATNAFDDWRLGLNWGAELYADAVTTSTRSDAKAPDFESKPKDRGNYVEDSTYTTFGAFLRAEQSPLLIGPHELVVSAGGRIDTFSAFAPEVTPEIGDVDYSFAGFVGSASLAYLYEDVSNVYVSWNQGFRAPNLQETTVLGDTGNFFEVPNPDLAPERSDTFELGHKLDVRGILKTEAAVFATFYKDRITREDTSWEGAEMIDDKQVVQRVNRDTAYNYGLELDVTSYPVVWDVSAYGNMAYIDSAVEADAEDENFKSGPLHSLFAQDGKFYENPRRLPPVQWLAGLRWERLTANVSFWVEGNSGQSKLAPGDLKDLRICEVKPGLLYKDLGQGCPGSESFVTLNARGGYGWEKIRLDLSLKNLTDQRYRYHGSGFLSPGFNAMLNFTYHE